METQEPVPSEDVKIDYSIFTTPLGAQTCKIGIKTKAEVVQLRKPWIQVSSTEGSLGNYPRPQGHLPMFEWGLKQ